MTTSAPTSNREALLRLRQAALDRLEARLSLANGARSETFLEFFDRTRPRTLTVPDHIVRIGRALQRVNDGDIDRLRIHMPPRHGKTETCTLRFSLYYMLQRPEARVLITSHTARMASRFGKGAQRRWLAMGHPVDGAASDDWTDGRGRSLSARGVGQPPTGMGFDLIIIDDPIKSREEADSITYRDRTHAWYTDDILTRLEPNGAIVMISTRWHHDDLPARVASTWENLTLPAIDAAGNALWPDRYPVEALESIRQEMRRAHGDYSFEALYQQNPTPREGSHFTVGNLIVTDSAPRCIRTCRGWDLAATAGGGDWSAGVKLGVTESGEYVVLDVVRGRYAPEDLERIIVNTALADGVETSIALPIDPGQAGKAQYGRFARMLSAFNVVGQRVTGSKLLRSSPLASALGNGLLTAVRSHWLGDFVEELRQFPAGAHDDQVDAASEAYNTLHKQEAPVWQIY